MVLCLTKSFVTPSLITCEQAVEHAVESEQRLSEQFNESRMLKQIVVPHEQPSQPDRVRLTRFSTGAPTTTQVLDPGRLAAHFSRQCKQ